MRVPFTAALSGNATTASTLQTARNIAVTGAVTGSASFNGGSNISITTTATSDPTLTLAGDVTGSATFTNLGNATLTATIAANSVALGTDTTGNYVATIATGAGLDGSASSEGATPTITLNLNELTTSTTNGDGDFFVVVDTGGVQRKLTKANINNSGFNNDAGYTTNVGDITGVTAGVGLSGGGTSGTVTVTVDLSELTDMTAAMVGTDEFIVLDAGADRRKAANEIGLSIFNNDAGFTTNVGDITGVTAGSFLTGGGTSGTVTLNVDATSANTASKVVARDASGNFAAGTITAALSGNATTATTLQTARTINGVSFNGSANITVADATKLPLTGGTISGTLTLSQDGQDVLNFSANDTNDSRGISFNSRTALSADYNDGWLRLNQLSEFTNGVYTPSSIRADAGFVGNATTATTLQTARTINGVSFNGSANITVADATKLPLTGGTLTGGLTGTTGAFSTSVSIGAEVVLAESTDRADLLQISSTTSTWGGLQIRNSSNEGRWSFMTDGETAGIYNDEDNQWHIFMTEAAGVDLRHASVTKLATTSAGVTITGTATATTFSGALSGNATTATTLATARTINGVSFNGSANITVAANTTNTLTRGTYLTGSNFNGSAATTWAVDATTAATASKVVARDGNGYVFAAFYNSAGTFATTGVTSGMARFTGTNGTDTYGRSYTAAAAATLLSGSTMNIAGNATTATTLQTARTIGGVSFDGSANINLPGVNTAGNQNTSGTAAGLSATLAVASGGTGATTLTANNVLLGNGTSAVQAVAPGTSGNVLTSNGTTWTSAPASGGGTSLCGRTVTGTCGVTALGYNAATAATSTGTTAVGYYAACNVSGSGTTAIGYKAGQNVSGSSNTIIGCTALSTGTGGCNNVAIGASAAGGSLYAARCNVAIGSLSMYSATSTSSCNVAVGILSMYKTVGSSCHNVAVGFSAACCRTSGKCNTGVGSLSLQSTTTAWNNTAIGYQSMAFNTTGGGNVAVGSASLRSVGGGTSNVALGYTAGCGICGSCNVAIGCGAMASTSGGMFINCANVAVGRGALQGSTSGVKNACNTIALGANAGSTFAVTPLGFVDATNLCDHIIMGNNVHTCAQIKIAWTVVSDCRDKACFREVPHGLDFVNALKPTEYQFKKSRDSEETDGVTRYGFLAQDIIALEGESPVVASTGDPDKLKYTEAHMVPILVKAIQELSAEVKRLKGE